MMLSKHECFLHYWKLVVRRSMVCLTKLAAIKKAAIKKALLGDTEPFSESNVSQLWHISRRYSESLTQYKERIAGLVEKASLSLLLVTSSA